MRTRTFILLAVAVFAVLVGGFLYVALGGGSDERRAGALRTYTAGNWYLEAGGVAMGVLRGVEGCRVEGKVLAATPTDKRAGASEYGPCQISFGIGLAPAGWQWINESAQGAAPRNAVLIHVDSTGVADFQLNLTNAWIHRFEVPKLDASGNEQATFRAELGAQRIDRSKAPSTPKAAAPAKSLLSSNFRLTISGLDTSKVSVVEPWAFETVSSGPGDEKPPPPALGNLEVLTSETAAKGFEDYLRASLILGESVPDKTAKIELLSNDLQSVLFAVDFGGVGIIEGDLFGSSESSTSTAKRGYSFYVETMSLKPSA